MGGIRWMKEEEAWKGGKVRGKRVDEVIKEGGNEEFVICRAISFSDLKNKPTLQTKLFICISVSQDNKIL